jgi:hypothetical protein
MSEFGHSIEETAIHFAKERGIAVAMTEDMYSRRNVMSARLVKHDEHGALEVRITEDGADYKFAQLDYFSNDPEDLLQPPQRIRASRMIATVMASGRTELAYWTETAPTKKLAVHQGRGSLVIGNPQDGETSVFLLDPEVTPSITLPSGRFYTFRGESAQDLVVSGFYEAETPVDWDEMEIALKPGQAKVDAPEGTIDVPEKFRELV